MPLDYAGAMSLILILLLIALIFGIGGLFTAAKWLLIIALIFVVAGVIAGRR